MEGKIDLSKRIILGFTYCLCLCEPILVTEIKEDFFFQIKGGKSKNGAEDLVVLVDESLLKFLQTGIDWYSF